MKTFANPRLQNGDLNIQENFREEGTNVLGFVPGRPFGELGPPLQHLVDDKDWLGEFFGEISY